MHRFSHLISFTSSAWQALTEDPRDPLSPIRSTVESLGGKLLSAYFTEGDYDVLALTEFPEAISPEEVAIALFAGGAVATIHSSQLVTVSQADEAKRKSGARRYRVMARSLAASA